MATNNAIKALVKGISGAAITGTAELVKKVGPEIKKKKQTGERTREGKPKLLRPGLGKSENTLDKGGKLHG